MSGFFERLERENEIIIHPGQSQGEFLEEFIRMWAVVRMQEDFLSGKLEADTFLDFLDQQEFDVYQLADNCWNPC
ncbi:hypothetical protein [Scytonema millei]|uniref:Uncharacterized protein n=1 Tax=Scytonema millei VB511283 TaxID=1245923 RepID=A0A9X5E9V7_9CYAN|nr:hypothetical protein [Scytonema millei]NHC37946.1 hypothetical protein [Scytonema millei VB511283]